MKTARSDYDADSVLLPEVDRALLVSGRQAQSAKTCPAPFIFRSNPATLAGPDSLGGR